MEDLLQALQGKPVMVATLGYITPVTAPVTQIGILDSFDEAFLYLAMPDGDSACVPRNMVRSIRPVDITGVSEEERLLQPSSAPSEDPDNMLRPAAYTPEEHPNRLLRAIFRRKEK